VANGPAQRARTFCVNLVCGSHTLDLTRPRVMGILNVTPDSFYDGGRYADVASAVAHARQMAADGADIVDVGGESTRPGATPVSEAEELRRVVPVIEALVSAGIIVSADTRRPAVMRAAIAAGAAMINDVGALSAAGALQAVAPTNAAICLMHMRGEPASMQQAPQYDDVVREVREFLRARARACEEAGIAGSRIVVDPGFGFGKTLAHNLALLRALPEIVAIGYPVLAGLSRKSSLAAITGRAVLVERAGVHASHLGRGQGLFAHGAAAVIATSPPVRADRVR